MQKTTEINLIEQWNKIKLATITDLEQSPSGQLYNELLAFLNLEAILGISLDIAFPMPQSKSWWDTFCEIFSDAGMAAQSDPVTQLINILMKLMIDAPTGDKEAIEKDLLGPLAGPLADEMKRACEVDSREKAFGGAIDILHKHGVQYTRILEEIRDGKHIVPMAPETIISPTMLTDIATAPQYVEDIAPYRVGQAHRDPFGFQGMTQIEYLEGSKLVSRHMSGGMNTDPVNLFIDKMLNGIHVEHPGWGENGKYDLDPRTFDADATARNLLIDCNIELNSYEPLVVKYTLQLDFHDDKSTHKTSILPWIDQHPYQAAGFKVTGQRSFSTLDEFSKYSNLFDIERYKGLFDGHHHYNGEAKMESHKLNWSSTSISQGALTTETTTNVTLGDTQYADKTIDEVCDMLVIHAFEDLATKWL